MPWAKKFRQSLAGKNSTTLTHFVSNQYSATVFERELDAVALKGHHALVQGFISRKALHLQLGIPAIGTKDVCGKRRKYFFYAAADVGRASTVSAGHHARTSTLIDWPQRPFCLSHTDFWINAGYVGGKIVHLHKSYDHCS